MDNFKFNIGDIVNTNNSSYQFCNPKEYTWDAIVKCNCKSNVFQNEKIIDRISVGPHNWYKFDGFGNWYEESCISLVNSEYPKYLNKSVHCKTQEEWDFASKKLNRTDKTSFNFYGDCINLSNPNSSCKKSDLEKDKTNEILSFEDWCKEFGHTFKTESRFEVGKWYKVTNSIYDWYSKFKELIDDRFYFSDIIDIGKKEYSNSIKGNLGSYFNLSCTFTLLTDLSIIQEFLPEGHVDEIKKNNSLTIDGEYYSTTYLNQGTYIFIASGDNKKVTRLNDQINRFTTNSDLSTSNGFKEYKLATQEEKDWLNACIKANKFISKEEALKPKYIQGCDSYEEIWIPKVGDYLYLISGTGNTAKEGSIAKVTKAPYHDSFFKTSKGVGVEWIKILPEGENQMNGSYYFYQFRKALPHEIPVETSNKNPINKTFKFKVGDKVRFKSSESMNAKYFEGKFNNLEIFELSKEGPYDYFIIGENFNWGVKEDELEFDDILFLPYQFITVNSFEEAFKKQPKDNLEFQEPVIVKTNKNKKFKLVTINQ